MLRRTTSVQWQARSFGTNRHKFIYFYKWISCLFTLNFVFACYVRIGSYQSNRPIAYLLGKYPKAVSPLLRSYNRQTKILVLGIYNPYPKGKQSSAFYLSNYTFYVRLSTKYFRCFWLQLRLLYSNIYNKSVDHKILTFIILVSEKCPFHN